MRYGGRCAKKIRSALVWSAKQTRGGVGGGGGEGVKGRFGAHGRD